MWCNDHIDEIHPDHAMHEDDLKFYDTLSIVAKYNNIFVCGWHGVWHVLTAEYVVSSAAASSVRVTWRVAVPVDGLPKTWIPTRVS